MSTGYAVGGFAEGFLGGLDRTQAMGDRALNMQGKHSALKKQRAIDELGGEIAEFNPRTADPLMEGIGQYSEGYQSDQRTAQAGKITQLQDLYQRATALGDAGQAETAKKMLQMVSFRALSEAKNAPDVESQAELLSSVVAPFGLEFRADAEGNLISPFDDKPISPEEMPGFLTAMVQVVGGDITAALDSFMETREKSEDRGYRERGEKREDAAAEQAAAAAQRAADLHAEWQQFGEARKDEIKYRANEEERRRRAELRTEAEFKEWEANAPRREALVEAQIGRFEALTELYTARATALSEAEGGTHVPSPAEFQAMSAAVDKIAKENAATGQGMYDPEYLEGKLGKDKFAAIGGAAGVSAQVARTAGDLWAHAGGAMTTQNAFVIAESVHAAALELTDVKSGMSIDGEGNVSVGGRPVDEYTAALVRETYDAVYRAKIEGGDASTAVTTVFDRMLARFGKSAEYKQAERELDEEKRGTLRDRMSLNLPEPANKPYPPGSHVTLNLPESLAEKREREIQERIERNKNNTGAALPELEPQ